MKDQIGNHGNEPTVSEDSLKVMLLHDLDVHSFKELDNQSMSRFIESFIVRGTNKIDFQLLQACLNLYKVPEEFTESPQSAITRVLLTKFNHNSVRVIEYLDIDNNGSVSKAEFTEGTSRIAHKFERVGHLSHRTISSYCSA